MFVTVCYKLYEHVYYFSSVALGKLLQHSIQNNDSRLQEIMVKGDQVHMNGDGIRTRSKASKGKHMITRVF